VPHPVVQIGGGVRAGQDCGIAREDQIVMGLSNGALAPEGGFKRARCSAAQVNQAELGRAEIGASQLPHDPEG
jgi:hypothetical protein